MFRSVRLPMIAIANLAVAVACALLEIWKAAMKSVNNKRDKKEMKYGCIINEQRYYELALTNTSHYTEVGNSRDKCHVNLSKGRSFVAVWTAANSRYLTEYLAVY